MKTPTREELATLADGEDARLLAALRRELTTARVIACPKCDEDVVYEPPYDAQPDCNVSAWPGGFLCQCGWERLDEKYDPADDI